MDRTTLNSYIRDPKGITLLIPTAEDDALKRFRLWTTDGGELRCELDLDGNKHHRGNELKAVYAGEALGRILGLELRRWAPDSKPGILLANMHPNKHDFGVEVWSGYPLMPQKSTPLAKLTLETAATVAAGVWAKHNAERAAAKPEEKA